MTDTPERRGCEMFYRDEDGRKQDEGLYDLEPADPEAFRRASAAAARHIGLSEATIRAIYGEGV